MNQLTNSVKVIPCLSRRQFIQYGSIFLGTNLFASCANNGNQPRSQSSSTTGSNPTAQGNLDKVTFGTNWLAEAEHGGFYQAIATGIYKNHGLDVTIKMGGPLVANGTQLLMGGAVDFFIGYSIDAVNAVAAGIPKITVAAIFQKDPQCLIAHPDTGVKTLADLKGKPIYVSASANINYWPVLKAKYGFTDAQKRPYNFNPGPFLADKNSAQQGYVTSEPFAIERQGGFKPVVFLLADHGYTPYAVTIETKKELVEKNPDLVQRFVDASIKGWYSYLENPAPGNELIKKDNPQMEDDQIAYGTQKLKDYGLLISGDATKQGIGVMTEERWKTLYDNLVKLKIFKPDTKYQDAFTLKFVNRANKF